MDRKFIFEPQEVKWVCFAAVLPRFLQKNPSCFRDQMSSVDECERRRAGVKVIVEVGRALGM